MRHLLFALVLLVPIVSVTSAARAEIQFNRDVRPILSDTCFHCHGPDANERKAGLRLDIRENAIKPVKSGETAIVPNKPDESELIRRVMTDDDDDLMPPTKLHKPLTAQQKQLLKQWIAEGAPYQGHWAFITPVRPEVPKASTPGVNEVDAFIFSRLEKEHLHPSPEADRATLIRRVSLDLLGLPPTPAEVEAFVNDKGADAYEKVVDRLLASPHYGEQMARQWLDFARYADSHGFQTDSSRQMWPWRDWVLRAFNSNMPFDQFTVQQLAGDLLPNATRDQIIATGFNRNHRLNGEGGIIAEEWRVENNIDRVETMSFTWLGLSMNCCRCHDHKFDPFTQKDFYSLFAFFNNVPESGTIQGASNRSGGNSPPIIDVPTAEQESKLTKLQANVQAADQQVAEAQKELPKLVAAWEAQSSGTIAQEKPAWELIEPSSVVSQGGATLTKQADGSYLAGGKNPAHDAYIITAKVAGEAITGFLLECLPDTSLPNESVGRAPNGNFVLSEFEVDMLTAENAGNPVAAKVVRAEADYSQKGYEVAGLAHPGGKARTKVKSKGWAVDGPTRKLPLKAMFVLDASAPVGSTITITLKHDVLTNHNIGRFRLSSTAIPAAAIKLEGSSDAVAIAQLLKIAPNRRTPKQNADVEKHFRTMVDSPVRRADMALAAARKAVADLEASFPNVMVMKEMPAPREAWILKRGEYDKHGDPVTMATPAVLPPMPAGAPLNRLGLAKWVVDPKNPLTARVWVNRTWEKFFGVGLCKTTENLGSQAEWPVHPELLDWLATEFIARGWDMKAFQKMLVMSATYRQSSSLTPALIERDPENRLLARGPRFRLSGEAVRDQALAISGLLVPTVGGPSVRPYMPEGVWDDTSKYGDLRGYKSDTGEGLYRRSIYTIWKRTAAPPTMLLFDAPSREICTVKRSRTNTPLQALVMLNEVTFVEASRGLAQQMIKSGSTPEARIAYGYLRATSRSIDPIALKTLSGGLKQRLEYYKSHPEDAKGLLAQGASKPDPSIDAGELAAYTTTAEVLLNLDRVVTRD